jgi:hypothetical protein
MNWGAGDARGGESFRKKTNLWRRAGVARGLGNAGASDSEYRWKGALAGTREAGEWSRRPQLPTNSEAGSHSGRAISEGSILDASAFIRSNLPQWDNRRASSITARHRLQRLVLLSLFSSLFGLRKDIRARVSNRCMMKCGRCSITVSHLASQQA